jgi:hypothetical protein
MEQSARESTQDGRGPFWPAVLGGGVVAFIFFVHAKLVGGAAEDHVGWQVGFGFALGMILVWVITDGMDFEYRKLKNQGDGTLTFWRFARTWRGLVFIGVELFFLATAALIMVRPNDFADLSHFNG